MQEAKAEVEYSVWLANADWATGVSAAACARRRVSSCTCRISPKRHL